MLLVNHSPRFKPWAMVPCVYSRMAPSICNAVQNTACNGFWLIEQEGRVTRKLNVLNLCKISYKLIV